MRWGRRPETSSSPWDVVHDLGASLSPSPRRRPLPVERVFVGMAWTAGAMWLCAFPVMLVTGTYWSQALWGYGFALLLLSLVPLVWALVVRRGRIVRAVRWTGPAVLLLTVVPLVLDLLFG